jgi:hypothetical protein
LATWRAGFRRIDPDITYTVDRFVWQERIDRVAINDVGNLCNLKWQRGFRTGRKTAEKS